MCTLLSFPVFDVDICIDNTGKTQLGYDLHKLLHQNSGVTSPSGTQGHIPTAPQIQVCPPSQPPVSHIHSIVPLQVFHPISSLFLPATPCSQLKPHLVLCLRVEMGSMCSGHMGQLGVPPPSFQRAGEVVLREMSPALLSSAHLEEGVKEARSEDPHSQSAHH